MMTPQATHALATLAIIALILWRLYARIRRSIGRQRLHPVRAWVTASIFPVFLIMLGVAIRSRPLVETSLLCGIAIGIGLGILGLHLTLLRGQRRGSLLHP
jgi:drug/metabolite transporter (DMT)-like permease